MLKKTTVKKTTVLHTRNSFQPVGLPVHPQYACRSVNQGQRQRLPGTPDRADIIAIAEDTVMCPMCEREIKDDTDFKNGEDAVFCDGECKCWR